MMKPNWINEGLKSESVMIASDGMPYAKLAHPRTAGTFSRVLGIISEATKINIVITDSVDFSQAGLENSIFKKL